MRSMAAGLLMTLMTSLFLGCIPWAQNLTRMPPKLPDEAAQHFNPSERVLVLPVWYDNGPCNIRGPLVLLANSLEQLNEQLKPRWRLGVMGIDGHGPSHYRSITAFVLVGADGSIMSTSRLSPIVTGALTAQLRSELLGALSTKGTIRSGAFSESSKQPFFGWACAQGDIGTKLDSDERKLAAEFLEQVMTQGGS
jgi:hypothetical protein